jgi:hypothetical protein
MPAEDGQKFGDAEGQFDVGYFDPSDAPGIVSLFQAVYGDGYPIRLFYDAKALIEANEKGTYLSTVARNSSGKVIGVQHLFRSAPYEGLYELGAGLVLNEYRNLNVITQLMDFMVNKWVPTRNNIDETFGEAVCNHLHMQRLMGRFSHFEMALEVALMPAAAYTTERSAPGRVAALLGFRSYKPKPHLVYLPKPYEQELKFLYSALDDERAFELFGEDLPSSQSSQAEMTIFDFAQVARIGVHGVGKDFGNYVANLENQAKARGAVVIQVWLDLSSPCVGSAVDILRDQGYFLGGPLPRWFDTDGLLMQKLNVEPDFENIVLYSDRSKEILGIVKEDWRRSQCK